MMVENTLLMKTEKTDDLRLREQLVELILRGNAHVSFQQATEKLSLEAYSANPFELPYSIWMLVEHIRTIQADILNFSRNPGYKEKNWPDDFWPKEEGPLDAEHWEKSLKRYKHDRDAFIALILNPDNDLYKPFPYGDGQNLLGEALLIADHTSYHVGEIIVLRRLLKTW